MASQSVKKTVTSWLKGNWTSYSNEDKITNMEIVLASNRKSGTRIRKNCFLLFFIALGVRLVILLTLAGNYISPDGTGYHTLAVNIAQGNGQSTQHSEPFDNSYFREPGYPYFLGGIYSVVNVFHPIQYLQDWNATTKMVDTKSPEIIAAQVVQSVLGALSIVFLYLILIRVADRKIALWTSIISAIFVQLAFRDMFFTRETLVMNLLLLMNLIYLKMLGDKGRVRFSILLGLLIGLLILTFQIHIALVPIFFFSTWIITKKVLLAIKHTAVIAVVVMLTLAPHCYRVFRYYPDIRIVKTFGTSLTHEQASFVGANRAAIEYGMLMDEDYRAEWGLSSAEQFNRSFDGFYVSKADSINRMIPLSWKIKNTINTLFANLKRSMFISGVGYFSESKVFGDLGVVLGCPILLLPRVIGLFGLLGLLLFWKKYVLYFLPFIAYGSLFWLLGSECRRMIVMQPFYVFFGILFLQHAYMKIRDRISKQSIKSR